MVIIKACIYTHTPGLILDQWFIKGLHQKCTVFYSSSWQLWIWRWELTDILWATIICTFKTKRFDSLFGDTTALATVRLRIVRQWLSICQRHWISYGTIRFWRMRYSSVSTMLTMLLSLPRYDTIWFIRQRFDIWQYYWICYDTIFCDS